MSKVRAWVDETWVYLNLERRDSGATHECHEQDQEQGTDHKGPTEEDVRWGHEEPALEAKGSVERAAGELKQAGEKVKDAFWR